MLAQIGLCGGVLGLTLLSWVRLLLTHTLALESAPLPPAYAIPLWALFGLFAALSGFCFLRLLRRPPPSLLGLAILLQLSAAPALPLTSSDVFCNLAYGRVAQLGENPYTLAPSALPDGDPFRAAVYGRWAGHPTPYGPAVVYFDRAATMGGSLPAALALFKLEMLAATLLAIFLGAAICRTRELALFALNPLVAWELSGQAHNDALLVLAFCAFLLGALRGRWGLSIGALAFALLCKPAAAPLFGLVLIWQFRSAPLRALILVALTAVLAAALYAPFWAGPSTLQAILRELRGDPEHLTHSFTAVLYELGGLPLYRVAQFSSLLLVLYLALRAALRADSLGETARGAALFYLLYGLVAAPWFQAWYICWLLPLLLITPDYQEVAAVWSLLALAQYAIPWHTATALLVNGVPLYLLLRRRYTAAPPGRAASS